MDYKNVIDFWFHEIDPSFWFKKDDNFDDRIRNNFLQIYEDVLNGRTKDWRRSAEGRLAEIIVLDQFSRNMFRGSAKAFQADALALNLAQQAVEAGDDMSLPVQQRSFIYMPYMHSENRAAHEIAVKLFSQPGLENNLKFELLHKKIIDRFGRYPHRNEVLGRISSNEEIEFLKTNGSSF